MSPLQGDTGLQNSESIKVQQIEHLLRGILKESHFEEILAVLERDGTKRGHQQSLEFSFSDRTSMELLFDGKLPYEISSVSLRYGEELYDNVYAKDKHALAKELVQQGLTPEKLRGAGEYFLGRPAMRA